MDETRTSVEKLDRKTLSTTLDPDVKALLKNENRRTRRPIGVLIDEAVRGFYNLGQPAESTAAANDS
jgi:hypothetical protein